MVNKILIRLSEFLSKYGNKCTICGGIIGIILMWVGLLVPVRSLWVLGLGLTGFFTGWFIPDLVKDLVSFIKNKRRKDKKR